MLMKRNILFSVGLITIFISCSKDIEDRIVGSWKLDAAWKQKTFSRDYFTTGYESGLFTFENNGTASYINLTDTLTGFWSTGDYNISSVSPTTGQLDTKGLRYFRIELVNFSSNRYLFWEFDDFYFRNSRNTIRATDFTSGNDRIYEFEKK